jgi:hypothetical protein
MRLIITSPAWTASRSRGTVTAGTPFLSENQSILNSLPWTKRWKIWFGSFFRVKI